MIPVTVEEAAILVNRGKDAIYRWIRDGKLVYKYDREGRKVVDARDVYAVEKATRRGRPATRQESA